MSRRLSSLEEHLMRALRLENVGQLDDLLAQPISQDAADHSGPPDEEYDLADRMYERMEREWEAKERFDALVKSKYIN